MYAVYNFLVTQTDLSPVLGARIVPMLPDIMHVMFEQLERTDGT